MNYSREFFVKAGRKGGKSTVAKYGAKHMKNIARKKRPRVKPQETQ